MKKYVSVRQLAERYDTSARTIWRWPNSGVLPPPEKIGGATRWDLELIEQRDTGRTQERGAA